MATTLGSEEIKKTHPEIMPPDTNVITSQSMPQRFSVTPREIKLKIITVADIVKCVIYPTLKFVNIEGKVSVPVESDNCSGHQCGQDSEAVCKGHV